ncbi:hypothetical protein CHELA40_30011 [Chelatococcus asaccharovorans]|nr:hypothetical protein CHELA17_40049 [Chelatococcus asaccharovorans]CAH1687473.1 hypothetical protein CHELA40_30011 [Chelatococcus asaccharovorans]
MDHIRRTPKRLRPAASSHSADGTPSTFASLQESLFGISLPFQAPFPSYEWVLTLEQIRLRWNRLMPSKPMNLLVIFLSGARPQKTDLL